MFENCFVEVKKHRTNDENWPYKKALLSNVSHKMFSMKSYFEFMLQQKPLYSGWLREILLIHYRRLSSANKLVGKVSHNI